jgi:type VI secretion system protein ImpE
LIPSRYPGSERAGDPRLAMGRATSWTEQPGGHCAGLGQRQLATDEGEYPLMEVRVIEFDVVASDAEGENDALPRSDQNPPADEVAPDDRNAQ